MQFPQVDIRADRARREIGKQMLGLRFKDHPMANAVQGRFFRGPVPEWVSSSPVMIPLALSLALASSGICNPFQKCNLELEARVGIGRLTPDLHT